MPKLQNNPRLSFMKKTLSSMDPNRKDLIYKSAEIFIEKNSY